MAQELEVGVHNESDLIEIATRLACEGYWQDIKQVMEVSKVFRYDEQLWDAMKDEPGGGKWRRTRLMFATLEGDLERVHFLLDRGARVNKECLIDGGTALMIAAQYGHLKIARLLLDRGANVNAARTDIGATALIVASEYGHLEIARLLLDRGAIVDAGKTNSGATALIVASQYGQL